MILLKLQGIDGDSKFKGHEKWITCESLNWEVTREEKESAKGGTEDINLGIADLPAVQLGKSMDIASVYLMQNAIAGKSFGTAEIHFVESQGVEEGAYKVYLEYKLDRAIIKSWSISASGDDRPEETVAILYNKIKMKYTPFDGAKAGPAHEKGWDTIAGKAW
jgi:type VI secretion system secreted protein Hcp